MQRTTDWRGLWAPRLLCWLTGGVGVCMVIAALAHLVWRLSSAPVSIPDTRSDALPSAADWGAGTWVAGEPLPEVDLSPMEVLLAAADGAYVVYDRALEAVVLRPDLLASDPSVDVAGNCGDVLAGFFVDALARRAGPWCYGHTERVYGAVQWPETQAVAVADFCGHIAQPRGPDVPLSGRVGISETAVLILARADALAPVEDLGLLAVAAWIKWPVGLEALGRTEHRPSGQGYLWRHGRWDDDSTLSATVQMLWPTTLAVWSDGTWLAVGLFIDGKPDLSAAAVPPPPPFIVRPGREPRCHPDDLGRYDLRPVSAPPEDIDVIADSVNGRSPVGREALRIRFLKGSEWDGGAVAPVPEPIAAKLGLAQGTESLSVTLRGDPILGDATVGLLACVDENRRLLPTPVDDACQWAMGAGYLAFTLVSVFDARRHGTEASAETPGHELERQLPMLLGADGTRLTAVPVAKRVVRRSNGLLAAPVGDTLVGFPEQYRVGDTDWGRCRIYSDAVMLHVVFDLAEGQ